ncbi:MAG: phytoene desaturase family protein [Verrucomicrobiota bacterium]
MMQPKRVNIIGAGPGGLASAMLLAKAGLDVHVFEKQPRVGGRTSAIEKDGFRFDMGPTFFMYPEILAEIFSSCGFSLDKEIELKSLDPFYRLIFEKGGQIEATPDVENMRRQIAAISPVDADQFPKFLEDNREKFKAFKPVLQKPFSRLTDLLDPNLLKSVPRLRPGTSVDTDLRRFFEDDRVRVAFSFQSKYLGMSPFRCPSLFTILSFLEYEYGVHHPIGGCAAISEGMARCARRLGATIHLGEEVTGLTFSGRTLTGVQTADGEHSADATIINADFAHAMRKLVPDALRKRWSNRSIDRKKFSCSTFMMYLGIEGSYSHLHHHNIFIAEDYAKNLREIEDEHTLSEDPSFYVQNPGVTDPTLAPEGMSTLYVLAPVSHQHGNIDWTEAKVPFRQKIIEQMEKMGISGLESRIRSETIYTPDDWQAQQSIHMGATFNLAHNFGQMLNLRPRNRFEDLGQTYLVGGGTHPGSGLPVIFESARISSSLLLKDLGVASDWIRGGRPEELLGLEPKVGFAS